MREVEANRLCMEEGVFCTGILYSVIQAGCIALYRMPVQKTAILRSGFVKAGLIALSRQA
jgi:hypothetical protein